MRYLFFAVAIVAVPGALCAHTAHHFDIVNASAHTITAVAVAPAGGQVFRKAVDESGKPVRLRSGESMTIMTLPSEGGCLRDMRVSFDNGQESIERDFDICKAGAIYRAIP